MCGKEYSIGSCGREWTISRCSIEENSGLSCTGFVSVCDRVDIFVYDQFRLDVLVFAEAIEHIMVC